MSKISCGGHVTQFWNFRTPLISREWLKLETSNLARRRIVASSNKKCKIGSKLVMWVHGDGWWRALTKRMQNDVNVGRVGVT